MPASFRVQSPAQGAGSSARRSGRSTTPHARRPQTSRRVAASKRVTEDRLPAGSERQHCAGMPYKDAAFSRALVLQAAASGSQHCVLPPPRFSVATGCICDNAMRFVSTYDGPQGTLEAIQPIQRGDSVT